MVTGGIKLGIDWTLGTDAIGGVDFVESVLELIIRFKRIQLRFNQSTADHYFRLYALGTLYKKMRGYRIS